MDYKYEDFKNDYDGEEDYMDGEDELAFIYTLDSAFAGDVQNMRVLGDIYSTCGYGVKVDYDKAKFWFGKAAEKGDLYSTVNLADLYYAYEHKGVPKDCEKAFPLYGRAAKEGHIKALARLGIMYLKGLGCKKNRVKARKIIGYAACEGNDEALYEYAHILKREGADNWKEYLKKAARNSNCNACWEMVSLYGDEITDSEFLHFLCNAANYYAFDYKPMKARLMLADCFMRGVRVKKNEQAAKSYYKMAAEDGSEEAKAALKKYFGIG